MADLLLFTTQAGAIITYIVAFIATVMMFIAGRRLIEGEFKSTIHTSMVFLIFATIGSFSMMAYHISQSYVEIEVFEYIWYVSIFLAMVVSIFNSHKIAIFGKAFADLPAFLAQHSQRMNKKRK